MPRRPPRLLRVAVSIPNLTPAQQRHRECGGETIDGGQDRPHQGHAKHKPHLERNGCIHPAKAVVNDQEGWCGVRWRQFHGGSSSSLDAG